MFLQAEGELISCSPSMKLLAREPCRLQVLAQHRTFLVFDYLLLTYDQVAPDYKVVEKTLQHEKRPKKIHGGRQLK